MIGKLLDRYMWVVDLVIIAVFAAFLAAGVDHFLTGLIDGFIRGAVVESPEDRAGPGKSAAMPGKKGGGFQPFDGIDILRRNIFDSITGPLDGVDDMTEELFGLMPDEAAGFEDGTILPPCSTPLVLEACYASPDYPEYSFVAIKKDSATRILHEGETIQSFKLERITWRYVFFSQTSGGQCYLDIWNEQIQLPAQQDGKPMTAQQKAAMGNEKQQSAADFQAMLNKSIKDLSPNEKDIDRSLIDYLVQNKHILMQSGRVLPNVEGEKINGFKVYGIRKTSLWGKLGIHNGDVVLSVNGNHMDGPDKAYEAFANLGGSDAMTLEVLRHGKPQSFTYNIK